MYYIEYNQTDDTLGCWALDFQAVEEMAIAHGFPWIVVGTNLDPRDTTVEEILIDINNAFYHTAK